MTTELETRYPEIRQFRFYVAVNNGFIVSANDATNILLAALTAREVSHYRIGLSPTGGDPPTHWGTNGLIRAAEAGALYSYYGAVDSNSIDSWILSDKGRRLWSRSGGWADPPDGPWTFDDFLQAASPPLLRTGPTLEDVPADFFRLLAIVEKEHLNWGNNQIEDVTDDSRAHLFSGFSSDGYHPPSSYGCELILPMSEMAEVEKEFPPSTTSLIRVVCVRFDTRLPFWNNKDGYLDEPDPLELKDLGDPWSESFIDGYEGPGTGPPPPPPTP